MEPNLNRRKLVLIPHGDVMRMFVAPHLVSGHFLCVWRPVELPEGFRVLSCHPDYQHNAIAFTVQHDSFEEVPDCCMSPEMRLTFEQVKVELKEQTANELGVAFVELLKVGLNDLCAEIEKLPASEQQTRVSVMASNLAMQLQRVLNPE